ncbi:hypothetical protein [Streptomyces sp. NPDC089919]|uniref:RICIN domain-containing protein n=1 Tax=Streptomyces sp. NPDC089919 TaxID=3155188 RepID=UPI00342F2E83
MEPVHRQPAPQEAGDAAEFVDLMRALKDRSGYTYRQLEERAAERGEVLPRSTLASVLGGRTLPRPELLAAFVRAGGDEARMAEWVTAWSRLAGEPAYGPRPTPRRAAEAPPADGAAGTGVSNTGVTGPGVTSTPPAATAGAGRPGPVGAPVPRVPWRLTWRTGAAAAVTALALVLAGMFASSGRSTGDDDRSAGPPAGPALPTGWVQVHPADSPGLCLSDGRVRDGRYTPLVAVQRPCASIGPQNTLLAPLGGDLYQIQWHHPDYGKGCLRARSEQDREGVGLLEPMDDCTRGSSFHVEPSGPRAAGRYVFRVDGQGCVGIRGDSRAAGTEAVMGHCTGKAGQLFTVEAVR